MDVEIGEMGLQAKKFLLYICIRQCGHVDSVLSSRVRKEQISVVYFHDLWTFVTAATRG